MIRSLDSIYRFTDSKRPFHQPPKMVLAEGFLLFFTLMYVHYIHMYVCMLPTKKNPFNGTQTYNVNE